MHPLTVGHPMALTRFGYWTNWGWSRAFTTRVLKRAQKRAFLDAELATERAKRLKMAQNLFVVMCMCFPVVLSFLDAGFEPLSAPADFWITNCYSALPTFPCVRATGYCRAMAQCALQNYSAQHSARYGSGSWVCNPMS